MHVHYVMGPIQIKPDARCVYVHGQPLGLGARAFDLLLALVERRDRVVTKEELLTLVWPGAVVEEGNLAVQVSALRKALGDRVIATVPGRGYRFTAPVVERAAAGGPAAAPSERASSGPPLGGWLPAATTPLLGRTAALGETQTLLRATRCLTLVGAGGAGKTRLALALADNVRGQYPGGVWWVALNTLSDPARLPQAVSSAIGGADPVTPPLPLLKARLADRETLLVLDNCEHLVEACADLAAELLRELPQLQLLATSRESLRIAGEVAWSVPPLTVPAVDSAGNRGESLATLGQVPSVQLLVARIRQHSPGFALEAGNAAALTQVCRGLDGLPLALELIAAQVGPRTLDQLAARLDNSLGLLSVGVRGGLPHHQTMAAAIDWGYRLLCELDRSVFLRLSVFVGGWTPESAAAACEDLSLDAESLTDALGRLLRASMVFALPTSGTAGDVLRFRMLEPIRQFGLAQLGALAQVDAVKQRVLRWFSSRSAHLAAQLSGPQQAAGYAELAAEYDNLRALLSWSHHHDLASGIRLAADLWRFWQVKGYAQEMLDWFGDALRRTEAKALPAQLRAEAGNTAGTMARTCGRYDEARRLYEAALTLYRQLGHRRGEAVVLNNLCLIDRDRSDYAAVLPQASESLALAREIGDRNLEGLALMHLGTAMQGLDRPVDAEASFRQSLQIFIFLGEQRSQGTLLNFLGTLMLAQGRWPEAERCYQEGLALNQALEDFWGLGISYRNLASLQAARGDNEAACELLLRSLAHYRRAGVRHGVGECFELLAHLERQRGNWQSAAWCWGVVEQLERDLGKQVPPGVRARRAAELDEVRAAQPGSGFGNAHTRGQQMTLADAYTAVLADSGSLLRPSD